MLVMCLLRHAKRSYRPWWVYWPRRHCWAHYVDEGLIEEVLKNGITGWLLMLHNILVVWCFPRLSFTIFCSGQQTTVVYCRCWLQGAMVWIGKVDGMFGTLIIQLPSERSLPVGHMGLGRGAGVRRWYHRAAILVWPWGRVLAGLASGS